MEKETYNDYKKLIATFLRNVPFDKDIAENYYGGVNEYYLKDKNKVLAFNLYNRDMLNRISSISRDDLVEAFYNTFSQRLELTGDDKIKYTAGQFYNIEVPQAIAHALNYLQQKYHIASKYNLSQIAKYYNS